MEWEMLSVPFQNLLEYTLSMELLQMCTMRMLQAQIPRAELHHSNPRDAEIHSHASKISCILLYTQMRFFYMEWLN